MAEYSLQNAKDFVAAAVGKMGPEFIYNPYGDSGGCWYEPFNSSEVPEGDPRGKTGCLIGTALKPILSESQLHELHGSIMVFWSTTPWFRRMFDQETAEYLLAIQKSQDNGASWGEAQEAGEKFLMEVALPRISLVS